MADLQDTNAATEEIYGPLLIVEYPVSDEMISKHWRSSSKRKAKFLHTYSIQNCFRYTVYEEYRNNGFRCETKENTRLSDLLLKPIWSTGSGEEWFFTYL